LVGGAEVTTTARLADITTPAAYAAEGVEMAAWGAE
jgi:hypothetical protein